MQCKINQLIQVQHKIEQVDDKLQEYQEKMKNLFDPGKDGKFGNIWTGLFKIESLERENTFELQSLQAESLEPLVNGHFLKYLFVY